MKGSCGVDFDYWSSRCEFCHNYEYCKEKYNQYQDIEPAFRYVKELDEIKSKKGRAITREEIEEGIVLLNRLDSIDSLLKVLSFYQE